METIMKILLTVLATLMFVSCGGYNTATIQKSEKGFFKFTGNMEQVRIVIDESELSRSENKDAVYQVKPGNHKIRVFRNEQLVVDRILFVDDQATMEVEIP
jgi:hypothetical protein